MKKKGFIICVFAILLVGGVTGESAIAPEGYTASSRGQSGVGTMTGIARTRLDNMQELTPQVLDWLQVNANGFGDPDAVEVSALSTFNGQLYAGTSNSIDGARIFRSPDGVNWTPVTDPGFGITHDIRPPAILDMMVFNGRIYASTGHGDGPGQIWRALDGVTWAPMTITGFSNPDTVDFTAFGEFNSFIYAGATNLISGAHIWRSFSGDNNTWVKVAPDVEQPFPSTITGFASFGGALYAAVGTGAPVQIWRSTGGKWTTVISDGFGNNLTTSSGGLVEYAGYLYVGTGNTEQGAQLWRTNNGTSWEQAIEPGFGDSNNQKVEMVFVFEDQLYVSVKNAITGIEVWRSPDGTFWEQVNQDGFGDSQNAGSNWSNATASFLGQLYLGTSNVVDGGELWRLEQQLKFLPLYIPLILR
jgi:hypothetical protein